MCYKSKDITNAENYNLVSKDSDLYKSLKNISAYDQFIIANVFKLSIPGVFPAITIKNNAYNRWKAEINDVANASGSAFLNTVLCEKIDKGMPTLFIMGSFMMLFTNLFLGLPNSLTIDKNIMIHVNNEKRYPFGIDFTSPFDSDFNVVDVGNNQLEISLRQPPAIKTYSKLPMDDDQGLVLYQDLLQNSTKFPPHRYPPEERAKVNVFREVEKMAPEQLEYLTGVKIGIVLMLFVITASLH